MPRVATLATLVALCALAPACSDSGDPVADPTTSPTTSSSAPTSTGTATESTEPTEPTVEPATGPLLDKMTYASVRAPEGWEVLDQLVRAQQEAGDDDTGSIIILGETENFAGRPLTLDEQLDIVTRPGTYSKRPKVLPNAVLDGVEAYHVAGQVETFTYLEEYGVSNEERLITLHFEFDSGVTPAERQEIVDSVVASFRWKDAFQR